MQVCNYCGRHLRQHYANCPGCSSCSFTFKPDSGEAYVLNTPPKDGYKLNEDSFKHAEQKGQNIRTAGICILTIVFMLIVFAICGLAKLQPLLIIIAVVGIICGIILTIIGNTKYQEALKNTERMRKLKTVGILIKNLPCTKTRTIQGIDRYSYDIIHVVYVTSDGKELHLSSSPRSSFNVFEDGLADLLIDPNDYSNYYIDTEIY